jgi:hypothetical protein
MESLEKPYDEYKKCQAEIFIGTKPLKRTKIKCFLWLPQNLSEEPHFYLLLEDHKEYEHFQDLLEKHTNTINLKIDITFLDGSPQQTHLIKKSYYSGSVATFIAKNWFEGFVKFHFSKHVLTKAAFQSSLGNKFRFFISESELFSSSVSIEKHYVGEIRRKVISRISLDIEVSHFDIEYIYSDQYIGDNESNILEITPRFPIRSLLAFHQRIKPIADLILVITSFAERRRLNWYKCDGAIGNHLYDIYNTRTLFYSDKREARLISKLAFKDFLKNTLQKIKPGNVKYITRLLRSYLLSKEYSVNAKIILYSSIIEKILKRRFQKKSDRDKKQLLEEMHVYISDLSPIADLIDTRNYIAHGDEINSDQLFKHYYEWEKLVERTLLQELQWNNLSMTDVHIDESKPYGL